MMSKYYHASYCLLYVLFSLNSWSGKAIVDSPLPEQTTTERVKIDQKSPSVFLKYEKVLPQDKAAEGRLIVLSLNNNTKWRIVYKLLPGEEKQGLLPILYYIQDSENYPAFKKAIGDVVISVGLNSGKAVKFTVPVEYLSRKHCVFVDYSYEWEKVNNVAAVNEPKHSISFCGVKLPPTLN
jgi:hypothetical protein